jgi:CBS domain containing-hemolysin-like protein
MELLGHIPRVGEQLTVGRHKITVTSAERTRVRTLSIEKISPSGSGSGSADKPPQSGN